MPKNGGMCKFQRISFVNYAINYISGTLKVSVQVALSPTKGAVAGGWCGLVW